METSKRPQNKPKSSRTPLGEIQPKAPSTKDSSPKHRNVVPSSSPRLPHHLSTNADANLSTRDRGGPDRVTVNNRITAIAEEDADVNKRDSQISTTSTISASKSKRKTHIGPWQLGRTLGKGATGRVRLAKHAFTGQTAAIKIVSKKSAAMVQSASMARMDKDTTLAINAGAARTMPFGIEREIVIMKLIEHPHIISLYDIWENRGELYLVLEYVQGGELFDYVSHNGALPEAEAVRLFRQIIAGLSYCHRFNICHRDLKPENLLLDENRNIKLADFGMAALQPNGQYLTTSCGSPHYAAPEIIQCHKYRGDVADIWSVGIILFAMLNGFLPFDGADLHSTLRLVKKGEYYLPPTLSVEASDLIQKILQKDPKRRITMTEIWQHPLLKKYERLHAGMSAPSNLPGPPAPLTSSEWDVRAVRKPNLDRELLRNLQILWHGEKEEELIRRLTCAEPNHEKLFYWALMHFREEQLENYPGETLQYSASDYHHARKPSLKRPRNPAKSTGHARRNSQFSILSDESRSRPAYYKSPGTATSKHTQSSYDPYRASRSPVSDDVVPSSMTVIRTERVASSLHSARKPSLPKTEHDEHRSRRESLPIIASSSVRKAAGLKQMSYSTISSRSSLMSSRQKFAKSTSYKRNVQFAHRRSSVSHTPSASHVSSQKMSSSHDADDERPITRESYQTVSDSRSLQSLPTPQLVLRPRRPASDLDLHNSRNTVQNWRDETRRVSVELSKICEEAFNRSSVTHSSDFSQQLPNDSPATTVSAPDTLLRKLAHNTIAASAALQDLMDRRENIIAGWGNADPQALNDIIETLDKRIADERAVSAITERRVLSDPTPERARYGLPSSMDTMDHLTQNRDKQPRAASDPLKVHDNTIRMVSPNPTSPIAHIEFRRNKAMPINSLKQSSFEQARGHRPRASYDQRLLNGDFLEPILEVPQSPRKVVSEQKKWSWLSRKAASSQEGLPPTPPKKDTPKVQNKPLVLSASSASSESLKRNEAELQQTMAKKRRWFQKMFSKSSKPTAPTTIEHQILEDESDDDDRSKQSSVTVHNGRASRHGYRLATEDEAEPTAAHVPLENGQSWFAKFLHLKPATSVVVVQLKKLRARKEIVRILREWRRYGLRDIAIEKHSSGDLVRARVDAQNYLQIRPVSFNVKLYTVLERGRKTNLSIARFTQEKGAASSFQRVVDTLESVLRESEHVLEDPIKKKAILKSMKQAGL